MWNLRPRKPSYNFVFILRLICLLLVQMKKLDVMRIESGHLVVMNSSGLNVFSIFKPPLKCGFPQEMCYGYVAVNAFGFHPFLHARIFSYKK